MNSPVSKLILLFGLAGKSVLEFGGFMANAFHGAIARLGGLEKGSTAAAKAARTATVANVGMAGSLAGLVVGGAVIVGLFN